MNDIQLIYRLTKELYDLKHKLDKIRECAVEINEQEAGNFSVTAINARHITNLIDVTEDYSEILNDND